LRIATWNIERLKHKDKLPLIAANCEQSNADILVLTETDSRLNLNYKFSHSTIQPEDDVYYNPTETRVTIYTNYELVRCYATFDEHTAVCVELKTEVGNMIVYGTVIGIYGNRHKSFMQDLLRQASDIERFSKENNLCVIGDFNCSFADNYYFTKSGRAALEMCFQGTKLR
jgi:endonuclease/exonuclease/phosphatase family metal-dependent hydrolase